MLAGSFLFEFRGSSRLRALPCSFLDDQHDDQLDVGGDDDDDVDNRQRARGAGVSREDAGARRSGHRAENAAHRMQVW